MIPFQQPNSNVSPDAFSAALASVRFPLSSAMERTTVATTQMKPIVVRTDKCCCVGNPQLSFGKCCVFAQICIIISTFFQCPHVFVALYVDGPIAAQTISQ